MIFFFLFLITFETKDSRVASILQEAPDPCDGKINDNKCTLKDITSLSSITIKHELDSILYVLFEDDSDNYIQLSSLTIKGNVNILSNRDRYLSISEELIIDGTFSSSLLILESNITKMNKNSKLHANLFKADTIVYTCGDNFSCPSIDANLISPINEKINVIFNEPTQNDKDFPPIFNTSRIMTIKRSKSCPPIQSGGSDDEDLNKYGAVDFECIPNDGSKNQASSYLAKFIGCKAPLYINKGSCEKCDGDFKSALFDGATSCENCPFGSQFTQLTQKCQLCEPGRYYEESFNECLSCPFGTFQSEFGQTECVECPTNSMTIFKGSTSIMNCTCLVGYFGPQGGNCTQCNENEICPLKSSSPSAKPGYYQDLDKFSRPLECMPLYACSGNSTCFEGYEGKFCGSCSEGYFRIHQSCFKCSKSVPPILGILMGLFLVLMFYITIYFPKWLPTLYITTTFLQEISLFGFFSTPKYISVIEFLDYLSLFYFNPEVFQLQCNGYHSWSGTVQIAISLPLVISFIFMICSIVSWKLPFYIKKMRGKLKGNSDFGYKDCLRVFSEALMTSFFVFFPAYLIVPIRLIKYTTLQGIKYFDISPASIYGTPGTISALICTAVYIFFLAVFLILMDYKISTNENDTKFLVVNWGTHVPVSYRYGHPYLQAYTNKYRFWIINDHLRIIFAIVFWAYFQKDHNTQIAFLVAVYLSSFSLLVGFMPYYVLEDYYFELLAKALLLLNIFITAGQIDKPNAFSLNTFLIITVVIFLIALLAKVLKGLFVVIYYKLIDEGRIGDSTSFKSEVSTSLTDVDNIIKEENLKNGCLLIQKILKLPFTETCNKQQRKQYRLLFVQIYKELVKYAGDSRQDFRNLNDFINDELRPFTLKLITMILLKHNTVDGLYLNQMAVEWEHMRNRIEEEKIREKERGKEENVNF